MLAKAQQEPSCDSPTAGACDLPDFPTGNSSDVSEAEFKAFCRSAKAAFSCYADHLERCTPFPVQLMRTQIGANLALFDVCERPDLYRKFEIFGNCGDKIDSLGNSSSAPGGGFQTCFNAIPNVLEAPEVTLSMQNYVMAVLLANQTTTQTPAAKALQAGIAQTFTGAFQSRVCCALNKLADCGLNSVRQVCSADAVTITQDLVTVVLDVNNCTRLQDTTNCGL